jgi:glutamine---fructose-6-phosphate transaminase (isomerizing)
MCGIFGMVRSADDADPAWASSVFVGLGHLAEERGRDAAGFALVGDGSEPLRQDEPSQRPEVARDTGPRDPTTAPRDPIHRRDVRLGRCRVVKDTRRWASVWQPEFPQALDRAQAAFGHTRHPSQGTAGRLANTSPLVVGEGLIGVHNGDVDAQALRESLPAALPPSSGDTDSEVLLLALDRVRGDLTAACDVLETAHGLAALAWVDRQAPDLVHLARAALCPLAIARDARGNLYWASSPAWFRRLDERTGGRLGFEVERIREGTLLAIAAGATPSIGATRSFEPVARPGDGWRFPTIWNGLDPADVEAFNAEARHRTVRRPAAVRAPELAEAAPAGQRVTRVGSGSAGRRMRAPSWRSSPEQALGDQHVVREGDLQVARLARHDGDLQVGVALDAGGGVGARETLAGGGLVGVQQLGGAECLRRLDADQPIVIAGHEPPGDVDGEHVLDRDARDSGAA